MSLVNLTTGKDLLDLYKETRANMLAPGFSVDILTLNETFTRVDLEEIIKQPGCESVRLFLGMDVDLNIRLVITGVDAAGRDILPAGNEIIAVADSKCPTDCPPASPINP